MISEEAVTLFDQSLLTVRAAPKIYAQRRLVILGVWAGARPEQGTVFEYSDSVRPTDRAKINTEIPSDRRYGSNLAEAITTSVRACSSHGRSRILAVISGVPSTHGPIEEASANFSWPPSERTLEETDRALDVLVEKGVTLDCVLIGFGADGEERKEAEIGEAFACKLRDVVLASHGSMLSVSV